ncbi:MAG TPA: PKD domain-containing protein, partial [Draconibacterium sp.]|nr:PKD domain-containing protein [Draconibacterium sp.]
GCQLVDTLDSKNRVYNISVGAFLQKQPKISLVINDNGCVSDTLVKTLSAEPNFVMSADKQRGCDSLTVNFKGELLTADNVEFVWTFDDSEIVNLQNVNRFYPDSGFYKVNLTITNPVTQCSNSFTIDSMIRVFPTPFAEISADPALCYPDSVLIVYTNNIDSSVCTWDLTGIRKWGNGNDSINVVIEQPVGRIKLTVNEYGCLSEPVEMQLKRKPRFDFKTESEEGCQPYSFEVFAETKDNFVDFTWITDSLPYPTGVSNLVYLPDTGRFDISLIANSNETGCADTLLKADWIWVHRNPYSKFEVNYQVALIDNAEISFINYSERAENYFWDFGDSITSVEFEPVHPYTELGSYNAFLYAESVFGCIDTFDLVIDIIPSVVYSSNAFRPDSDITENRTFMPVGAGVDETRFNLKIFNRWGEMIYETKSIYNPWNGTLQNGGDAPVGNYVWISKYYDIQGFEHNEKGQVLLIR